jgi:UDP-N-acetylglucosamine:LPS N-acetylglucosamine transferase
MGLHLSEGAIHTVQTPFAYFGYKTLNGFDKKPLNGIPEDQLKMVGCFIDHELLVDLENDNKRRKERIANGKPLRILMTVGGAGAGFDMFLAMVKHLIPYVKENKVTLFINFGDHLDVYHKLVDKVKGIQTQNFFNEYTKLTYFVKNIKEGDASGIYAIYNKDIFEAVYSTNLLMPVTDLLVTKPSELAYYPIPKLFMRHIGGHEVYGAINGRENGDSTPECPTVKEVNAMLDRLISDKELIPHMCDQIDALKKTGHYNGAYECVKLAVGK